MRQDKDKPTNGAEKDHSLARLKIDRFSGLDNIDPTLERLGKVWKQYPDLRLGQLILNVARDPMLYYLEDEELIKTLEEFYGISDINSEEA